MASVIKHVFCKRFLFVEDKVQFAACIEHDWFQLIQNASKPPQNQLGQIDPLQDQSQGFSNGHCSLVLVE